MSFLNNLKKKATIYVFIFLGVIFFELFLKLNHYIDQKRKKLEKIHKSINLINKNSELTKLNFNQILPESNEKLYLLGFSGFILLSASIAFVFYFKKSNESQEIS